MRDFIFIVLTILLWILYHRIFKVFYFGNPFWSIIGELVGAGFTATILLEIFGRIFSGVASALSSLGNFLFELALILSPIPAIWLLSSYLWSLFREDGTIEGEPQGIGAAFAATMRWVNARSDPAVIYIPVFSIGALGLLGWFAGLASLL